MKLYLAGPMTGYPDNNLAQFAKYAQLLRYRGYDVINPGEFDQSLLYDVLILEGLRALRECDGVAVHGKWRASEGVQGEVAYARTRAMPIRPWWYWDLFNGLWRNHTPL